MKTIHVFLAIIIVSLLSAGCSETNTPTAAEQALSDNLVQEMGEAAITGGDTYEVPVPPIPVSVECFEEDLQAEGTWEVRDRYAVTSKGHIHLNEYVDYSEVAFRGLESEQLWVAAPGAHESFSFNWPAGSINTGETRMHQFNARYLGPEEYPDLIISHSIHLVWDSNGQLRVQKIGIPFVGKCIKNAQ